MNKISVIIPTHNRANLLKRAIRSIQNQTLPVNEIIIVSDGSTDNTKDVVSAMQKRDSRIKFISYYPGRNGNYARNRGLESATGTYIAFLDDDDEWLPQKTEKQMKLFEEDSSIGLVYGAQNCIYVDCNLKYVTKPSWKGNLSERIFIHNDIGTPSQVIIKKSLLDQVGNFDLNLRALQDYDLWIRCCQNAKISFIKEPCINYYNEASTNQVSANTDRYIEARRYIAKKYENIIKTFSAAQQKKIRAIVEIRIAQRCLRNGDKKKARKYIINSLKIQFSSYAIAMLMASLVPYSFVLKIRSKFKY